MSKESVTLLGCGDVGPLNGPTEPYSTFVRLVIATGDIRFAQCERVYTEKGTQQSQGSHHSRLKPEMASIFSDCGFNVVSLASNHTMDFGADALLDTIELFSKKGIKTVGAGRNLEEARQPVIIEHNGVRVAILAYCSILQKGYAARSNRPGIAPLRVHTYYEPIEYQPGLPPRVVTIPYEDDLKNMVEDVVNAKKRAHVVVLSLHWGLHLIPRTIADYQPTIANKAFEAGADIILGHHTHVPKAIAIHRGKACFYSLSNFIMSSTRRVDPRAKLYGFLVDPDYPDLSHGNMDSKRSLIAKAELSSGGVNRVSFLPVLIDKQLRPEVLRSGDPRFDDAVGYMDSVSEDFDHQFVVQGDEVLVKT